MLPALGSTPAAEISAHDVSHMLDRVRAEHPTAANDLLRYTKRVLDFGVRWHALRVNAAYMLSSKDAGGKEEPRTRALSEVEVRTLLKKVRKSDSFGEPNCLAVKLLLCLCVRKAELLAARWNEFELDRPTKKGGPVWRLPGARTKTGNGVDIPLAPAVVSWLRRLRVLASDSEYLFPRRRHARRSRYPHVGLATLNAAIARWPGEPLPWLGRGNLALAEGDRAAAADAYLRAIQLAPGNAAARNNLAELLLDAGCLQESRRQVERAAALAAGTALESAVADSRAKIEATAEAVARCQFEGRAWPD